MVHLVKKNIRGHKYLYLQKSIYNNGKRRTEHVAYLGPKNKLTKEQINARIREENNKLRNSDYKSLNT